MNVLVDTSVWSLALRRRRGVLKPAEEMVTAELRELAREGRARLIGPVRQEILSGIREAAQFEHLRDILGAFPDEPLETADFESAAACANDCMGAGIAGASVDFLVCAIAIRRNWAIFTRDADFREYARVVPIALYSPRTRLR